jgi:hypothetical protein
MDNRATTNKASKNQPIPPRTEEVAKAVLDAAFKVHTALGPGLMGSVYETCLIHKAQLLTYLKLASVRLGLLINFNVVHLRDGIARLVN